MPGTQNNTSARTRVPEDRLNDLHIEDIAIRNYDHRRAYDVDVSIVDDTGNPVFENHYYLQPGQTESELNVFDVQEYEITVQLDNRQSKVDECTIDGSPVASALIELGNGTISVTERQFQ